MSQNDHYISIKEAAKLASITVRELRELVEKNLIPIRGSGKNQEIEWQVLEPFLNKSKIQTDCYIPIQDAAELAGISITYIRKLISKGTIVARGKGVAQQIEWQSLKSFIRSQVPSWCLLTSDHLQQELPPKELISSIDNSSRFLQEAFQVNRIVQGNCVNWLKQMPLNSVQTVVTSPPYWGVRHYSGEQEVEWSDGTKVAFGGELTPEDYVRHSTEVLRALKPVLKDDGTIWWNIGDTYQTRAYLRSSSKERLDSIEGRLNLTWSQYGAKRYSSGHPYLKDKDLTLIPFQVAIAAQRLGFYLRSIIIWSKQNVGLDAAKDRPTPSHEYILLFAKSRFYKYHIEHSREDAVLGSLVRNGNGEPDTMLDTRKWRSVWSFATSNSHGNHVAAFPLELPLRCIQASTDPGDLVLDPFMGSGTTALAAKILGRDYFGCDLVPEYIQEAESRLSEVTFNQGDATTKTRSSRKKKEALNNGIINGYH